MAKHGLREMDDVDAKLAHELSDCLWSVLVLADKYGIDLQQEFLKTMETLDKRIADEGSHPSPISQSPTILCWLSYLRHEVVPAPVPQDRMYLRRIDAASG